MSVRNTMHGNTVIGDIREWQSDKDDSSMTFKYTRAP